MIGSIHKGDGGVYEFNASVLFCARYLQIKAGTGLARGIPRPIWDRPQLPSSNIDCSIRKCIRPHFRSCLLFAVIYIRLE